MCPFCFATMGLIVAGAVSTGGLAALAVKVSRKEPSRRSPAELRGKEESKCRPTRLTTRR